MSGRIRFIAVRLLLLLVSLWAVVTITFLLVQLLPGDPAGALAGPYATKAQIAAKAAQLGLTEPLVERYAAFMGHLVTGNLGTSFYGGASIANRIGALLPSTLELIIAALIIALPVGLGLAALSAYFNGRAIDRVSSGVIAVLQAVPDFVMAVVLIYLFAALLQILPGPEGQLSIAAVPPPTITGMTVVDSLLSGDLNTFGDALVHLLLPAFTLGLVIAAVFARVARSALKDSLESDQTKFARSCGLPERQVLYYAILSARTPVLTYTAIIFGALFGGTAIVEVVFSWDGLSQWAVTSMLRNDYPAIQGFVLVSGSITLLVFLVLDVVVALTDPRVRTFATS